MKTVLFICVHNSGRSQMAEAFFNQLTKGKAIAISAGTEPGSMVNPVVVQAMKEIGIDISERMPKLLTMEMIENSDLAITMGCMEEAKSCPAAFVPSEDWGLTDPHDKPIEEVRPIRDEIRRRVVLLIDRLLPEIGNTR
jgi:arsenate reductase (thioredoxin)